MRLQTSEACKRHESKQNLRRSKCRRPKTMSRAPKAFRAYSYVTQKVNCQGLQKINSLFETALPPLNFVSIEAFCDLKVLRSFQSSRLRLSFWARLPHGRISTLHVRRSELSTEESVSFELKESGFKQSYTKIYHPGLRWLQFLEKSVVRATLKQTCEMQTRTPNLKAKRCVQYNANPAAQHDGVEQTVIQLK